MISKELRPITEDQREVEAVEAAIVKLLRKEFYEPLMALLGKKGSVLTNSMEDLIQAIASGQIQYSNGHFEGTFNAALSRELKKLGTWDRKHGWWKVPRSSLSPDVMTAIATSHSRFQQMANTVNKKLKAILPEEIAAKLKLEKIYDSTVWRVNKEFEASVKGLTVAPTLTPQARERIAKEYTQNMHLYIKDWTQSEIEKLRRLVQANTTAGGRRESLVQILQDSYDVGLNKAKFLARQETNLLVTKVKQTRYEAAGVKKYRWQCVAGSANHPVRPRHKALNGKIFSWTEPPMAGENGERLNPGQDYNCRCQAVPIVEF